MLARFEYELSKAEYAAGVGVVSGQLARHYRIPERHIWEQLGLFVVIILVAGFFFPDLVLGMVVGGVLLGLSEWLLVARMMKRVTGTSYDPAVASVVVEFTEDRISEDAGARARSWKWDALRRLHDLQSLIVLEFAGWDMLVLPERLWDSPDDRAAFVEQLRVRISAPSDAEIGPAPPEGLAPMLVVGAIAAGVDAMFLVTFLFPSRLLAQSASDGASRIAMAAGFLLLILAAGYVAYRLAKQMFGRMQRKSPRAASALAQLLVWPVPIYILVAGVLDWAG